MPNFYFLIYPINQITFLMLIKKRFIKTCEINKLSKMNCSILKTDKSGTQK